MLKVKLHQQQKESTLQSANFEICHPLENEDPIVRDVFEDNEITKNLCISTCPSIKRFHCALRYNFDSELFELMALNPLTINDRILTKEQGFIVIKPMDKIHFECFKCYLPHLFYFMLPTKDFRPKAKDSRVA